MSDVLTRALCVLALSGCVAHTKAARPRAALQNGAWLAGGVVLGGAGFLVIQDAMGPEDRGLAGASGALLAGTGVVMALGATLGLLGVAFDEVPAN